MNAHASRPLHPKPMMNRLCVPALLVPMLLAGCGGRSADAPVTASIIGHSVRLVDPNRGRLPLPQRVLLDSTAQGLVRLDASGQVEPGLAQRWITIDQGTSWIFRLREAEWPDGAPVTAGDVAAVLDRARAPGSRNALAAYLTNIDEVVAMTPEIVEIRLRRPIPALLNLLASPDLAILRQRTLGGSGPFRIVERKQDRIRLHPAFDPTRGDEEESGDPGSGQDVGLYVERAARALARFKLRRSDLVLGGSFLDWPMLSAANIPAANVRVDPAAGLFGLAVVGRQGFLGDPQNRAALAMAVDRAALTAAIKPDWAPVETVLPDQFDMAAPPVAPDWSALGTDERKIAAQARVQSWQARHPGPIVIRIALPQGPGAVRIWNRLFRDFSAIGLSPRPVAIGEAADLRLIDRVAPIDSARWYLTVACRMCGPDTITLIEAARDAPDLDARAHRLAEADALLAKDGAYIPIARPLRWSLVSARLDAWQGNSRAWHPLNRLRNEDR